MKFTIDPKIFAKFPGVRIGVLAILGMDNTQNQKEISQLLKNEEKIQNLKMAEVDFGSFEQTCGWREIYRMFGSKPNDFRSSIEALLRRVRAGKELPTVNPLVDLYNYLSIKHYLPVGAEDLDKIKGDLILTFASGNESGKYIGHEETETCYSGEVIYKDDLGFVCRRWNWREGDRTKITDQTTKAILVMEALPAISDEELNNCLKEAEELIKKFLGAKIIAKILSVNDNCFGINY